MGFLNRIRHHEPPVEVTCPNCGTPAPEGAAECTVCGWDLRESEAPAAEPPEPEDDTA